MTLTAFITMSVNALLSVSHMPRGPTHIFYDGGGGGGEEGGPKDFFGSDILVKMDFSGFMKDVMIFWGHEKNMGIFLGIAFSIGSNQ